MSKPIARLNEALEDRYHIERTLGEGGMATVYLAQDLKHHRSVAVKVFSPEATDRLSPATFLHEIEIVAGLSHPHILPLHDSGTADGQLYFVMPYVDGGSLRSLIKAQGALPVDRAIQLAAEIADALQVAHENGVLHRDIKPENILLSRGHALLVDFGIAGSSGAQTSEDDLTRDRGTPRYMSPEQASPDTTLDVTSDLYSLGCVLFEMLSGRPPFEARSAAAILAAHLTQPPPSLTELGIVTSGEVQSIVDSLLAKDPSERPRSATAVLRLFRRLLRGGGAATALAGQPNVGRIVTRMCDRWRQVNAFDAFLRQTWKEHPRRPHVYFVHGEEGAAHSSLVDRLAQTRIHQFANRIAVGGRGHVARVNVPWPTGFDLGTLSRDLSVALFRELAPSYMGDDLSADRLLALPSVSHATVVMIEHSVHATHWNATTIGLLDWYCRDFLGSVDPGPLRQQVLVFAKVTYPASRTRNPVAYWSSQRIRKRIHRDLGRMFEASDASPLGLVMDELGDISIEDVRDWFAKNRIYDSEDVQHRLAESVLAGSKTRGLAAVEVALEEIHSQFVTEYASGKGGLL